MDLKYEPALEPLHIYVVVVLKLSSHQNGCKNSRNLNGCKRYAEQSYAEELHEVNLVAS